MKLAEALILRADMQKRIEEIKVRLIRNAKIQEGDDNYEKPAGLLRELDGCICELTALVQRINKTNSSIKTDGGETISDLLAKRDITMLKRSVISALSAEAASKQIRYGLSIVMFKVYNHALIFCCRGWVWGLLIYLREVTI